MREYERQRGREEGLEAGHFGPCWELNPAGPWQNAHTALGNLKIEARTLILGRIQRYGKRPECHRPE